SGILPELEEPGGFARLLVCSGRTILRRGHTPVLIVSLETCGLLLVDRTPADQHRAERTGVAVGDASVPPDGPGVLDRVHHGVAAAVGGVPVRGPAAGLPHQLE